MLALISFLFFTGLVAVVSYRMTHKDDHESSTGYFLAGRSLSWIVVAGSLLLTNLSTEQLVGLNGGGYRHGMQVMAWEVWSALAMVLMALVFLPRYLKGGVTTVSQFLERRYDRQVGILISVLLLLSLLTNLLPFVLYSGALFMVKVFGVSALVGQNDTAALWLTVIALGTVGSIYAIFGGLKAVAVSDTLNGIGLLVGGLLIPILGLSALGDGSIAAGLDTVLNSKPELPPDHPHPRPSPNPVAMSEQANIPFSTLFTGMLLITTYYWCTNQAIVQRTFGSKSLATGQKGVLFAAFMKLLGPLYLVLPGMIAWHMFGALENPDDSYGMLVQAVLPPAVMGFFSAVIFGAILSSFNSGLQSATTLYSVDLYKGVFKPDASDADTVKAGKKFGIIIAVGAILVAPFIAKAEGGLFDLMKKLAALYNIPLLAITIVGIVSKRIPALGAKLALGVGFVFYAFFGLIMDNSVFGVKMHWLHVAALNFLVITIIMIVVGKCCPREEAYEQTYTEEVDIEPWKHALPFGIGVVVSVAIIYFALSRFS